MTTPTDIPVQLRRPGEASTSPRAAATRLHFLDHLRAVIILLVILLHASMTYMAYPPEWWYVIEPRNSLALTGLVLLLDVPNMQILFFIAGFFAYESLEKYGPARFLRQKALRLGLPWLVGVVFLAPLVTYLIPYSRGIAPPYLQFWTVDFWVTYYQQSVYWFLGMLLLLFAVLAAFYHGEPSLQAIPRRAQMPDGKFLAKFWAFMTLWYVVAGAVVPPDTWLNALRVIVYQPARLGLYVGYFILGLIADRRGWFRAGGYQPDLEFWGPAAFMSAAGYVGLRLSGIEGGVALLAVEAMLFNALCLSALMAGVALFQTRVNRPTRVWASLDRNAYAIYYLHPLVLYPATYLALSVGAPILVEVVVLTAFTALASWALGALFLTRLPGLRRVF